MVPWIFVIIGSGNGLLPDDTKPLPKPVLMCGFPETYLYEISFEIQTFSFRKTHLKMLSAKCLPFCLGLNVLSDCSCWMLYDFHDLLLTHWPLGNMAVILRSIILKLILWINILNASCKVVVMWMPLNSSDGKSTLVQVMPWCYQAPSHYLRQCWHRSMSPYGITTPQLVNSWYSNNHVMIQIDDI